MMNVLDGEVWGIIFTTLRMVLSSTAISAVLGTALGLLLECARFPGKQLVVRINRTLMGVPPVVMGLIVYLMLMRKGPLWFLNMLFTVPGMVLAQALIITPIICGMVYSSASRSAERIRAFGTTMGVSYWQAQLLMIKELRAEIYFAVITGFGRAISEVGAIMIVGGNIQFKTRTMTTAIMLLRNKGNYSEAIFLGAVLMLIAFVIQTVADATIRREDFREDENF